MNNTQTDPTTNNDDKIEVSNPNPTPQPTPTPEPQAPKPSPTTPTPPPTPEPTPPPASPPPSPTESATPSTPVFTPAPAAPTPQPETPTPEPPPPAEPTPVPPQPTTPPPPIEPPKSSAEDSTAIPISTPASPSNHPPTKNEPQIAEETPANHIDAGQYDMDHSIPPVKKTSNVKGAMVISGVAVIFLAVGFFGGFFGYKYSPKLAKLFSSSADTTESTTEASSTSTPKSTSSTPSEVADWPIYSNTKYLYSIKYPDTWYSQGTGDAQSKTVQFTSYKSDEGNTSTNGFKVEIVFQDSNGKELKDWVTANNTAAGTTTATPQEIQVDGKVAYQQTTTAVSKSISTYIGRSDQIMIVTYYSPDSAFNEGKTLYDKIIGSIKLM